MKRKFVAVMVLCFIFGGYFILSYISQVHLTYSRAQFFDNITKNASITATGNGSFRGPARPGELTLNRALSPESLIYLLGGIMFIIAGLSIWYLVREKEINAIKEEITDAFLLPEEKHILDELKKSGGEAMQRELVRKTGLSKVRVHRVLNKLEAKGIIKRHPYGLTKKIVLSKKIYKK